jgi:hypothetical protein
MRLLEHSTDARELMPMQAFLDSLDELVVGVVEAVEECFVAPPRDCFDLRARAEVEAARWVDDFLADDVSDDHSVAAQQAMFVLAQVLADAVADGLVQRGTPPAPVMPARVAAKLRDRLMTALNGMLAFGASASSRGFHALRVIRSGDASRRADDLPVVGVRPGND